MQRAHEQVGLGLLRAQGRDEDENEDEDVHEHASAPKSAEGGRRRVHEGNGI